ncbi:MAG TPA: HEAT repeat domain-containing protein, partial [Planctomycetota bacterium]|nr:HEAT repeat domain-containing protein [Planctomycetota bacterium]
VVVATTKNEQRNTPNQVLQVFSLVGSESVAEGTPLREALRKSLQDQSIAEMLIGHLQPSVLRVFEVEVHAALAQAKNPGTLLDSITRAGVTLSADDWLRQLRQPSPVYRQAAFGCLPTKVEPAVLREVEARLQDEEPGVRIAACSALARFLSPDSVTPLLQALRDSQEQVRTAAADALQRIRFFQDQQTHWQNVQAGVEIGKDSAAAKLVLQAKPGAAKDQRLLAIRSLAVLGAPEAQPYLIEWSQDPDAEIAAAARAAVAKIHQTAGVK